MPIATRPRPLAVVTLVATVWGILASSLWAEDMLQPLDLRHVRVGGEIGRRIDITVHNNLLVLNVDKDFLAPFQTRGSTGGYIGLGKLIDATVRLAAYTNDAQVLALKKHLVDEVLRTQEADGYLGMFKPEARMWGLWDVHEIGYLIYGLTTDYRYFGEKRSLAAAQKAADYLLTRWNTMPADWPQQTNVATHVSVTGLERTILALYRETQDPRYLDFVVRQRALPEWDLGIVFGRHALIEGHAYAYLARCLAQLELAGLQPDARLLSPTRRAMQFLTAGDGLTITGATGQAEIWTDDQDGRNALGETCTTAYQLRVYDRLLQMEGKACYGDLMERTIHNTLFAAQSPEGRQIRYFAPFEGERTYHPEDTYCCPNNFRRIIAELPTMVYYQTKTGAMINLYTPSECSLTLSSGTALKLKQETDYPSSGRVVLHVEPARPSTFPLQLRIPRWCGQARVAVNGQAISEPLVPGTFFTLERRWQAGDRVTLDLPMSWRLVAGRQRQAGRAALMRGPLVFCLNPAQNDSLAKKDAADLGFMMIDPNSVQDVPSGDVVHPGSVAGTVKASDIWGMVGCGGNLTLKLTEFPDPDGKCVYFRLPDPRVAVPDELVGSLGDAQ